MPTESDHKYAADRNLAVAEKIVDEYPEWGAITAFYSALHRVCEACATHSLVHNEHYDRNEHLAKNWRDVWRPYKFMYDESMKARYLTSGLYSLSAAEVRKQIIRRAYTEVVKQATNRRKTPLIAALPAAPPPQPPKPTKPK